MKYWEWLIDVTEFIQKCLQRLKCSITQKMRAAVYYDEEERVGLLSGLANGPTGGRGIDQQTCCRRWSLFRLALIVTFVVTILIFLAFRLSDSKDGAKHKDGDSVVVPDGSHINIDVDDFNLHDQYTQQPTLKPTSRPTVQTTHAPTPEPTGTASPTWPFPPLIIEPHTRDVSRPAERRCGGLMLHPVKNQLKFQTSGEIQPVHTGAPDLFFLASGAEGDPYNRSFFDAVGQDIMTNIWNDPRETYVPINERKLADVLFRSSNCDTKRDNAARIIKRIVESAGFTFRVAGHCLPEAIRLEGEVSKYWWHCELCKQSKIVLALERHYPGYSMLMEKPFVPLEWGAISAYRGNGHHWMTFLGVNMEVFELDWMRLNKSDQALGHAIVAMLRNPEKMARLQKLPVFTNLTYSRGRGKFFVKDPKDRLGGNQYYPEIAQHVRSRKRFANALDKDVLTYWASSWPISEPFLKDVFNASRVVQCPKEDAAFADIEWNCYC